MDGLFPVYFDVAELRRLQAAAEAERMTATDWARAKVLDALEEAEKLTSVGKVPE